jgi:hypothetical protein
MKSQTISLFSILIALDKFKDIGVTFTAGVRDEHFYIIETLLPASRKIPYSSTEIQSVTSQVKDFPQKLKEYGFNDTRGQFVDDGDLAVLTVMDLMGAWMTDTSETSVMHKEIEYKAVRIANSAQIFTADDGRSILQLTIQSDAKLDLNNTEVLPKKSETGENFDHEAAMKEIESRQISVFIEKVSQGLSGMELFSYAYDRMQALKNDIEPRECVATIPFASIVDNPNIDFVEGMVTNDGNIIGQAVQKNTFELNLEGIRAKSVTGLSTIGEDPEEEFVVDEPFIIWLTRTDAEGNHFPLFVANLRPDSWQKK